MNTIPIYDVKNLVIKIGEGNETAFRQLFNMYNNRLFLFAERMIKSKADAEEIVQDAFMKVWTGRGLLADIDDPEGWLFAITRNKTIDYIRRATKDERLLNKIWNNLSQSDNGLEENITLRDYEVLVTEAVDRLTAQQRQVYHLSRVESLTHEEIAERLGLSKSRIKNIMVEALKHIRAYLMQHSDLAAVFFWIMHASGSA